MDNSWNEIEADFESDVTPEMVEKIRQKAAPYLEGEVFTLISSADPSAELGAEYVVRDGVAVRV